MLRTPLIYLSKADWARNIVTRWPVAWRVASRFVAGDHLEDAVRAIQALNDHGINATLDHLGEHTTTEQEARQACNEVTSILDVIQQNGLRANVSIKLSQIGLNLDMELCADNLECILAKARSLGNFVRIDMENSPRVDKTLELYWMMRGVNGLDNTGVVLQSYLYRTEADLKAVIVKGGRVRLCKGAYKEPAEVAYPKKADVDANYDRLARLLIEGAMEMGCPALSEDGRFPPIPAIASHDERRIEFARNLAMQLGLPKQAIEFQMLYGIRRDIQERLVGDGYPVRVYVPYGTEWYPYFVRRLAERPANIWFFVSNFFKN